MSVINTNITSMIGQQNLSKSQSALTTSMERLSSGLRINSAKDDAAGQAIANRFSAQITGLNQAQRNANDGISIAQTAEGGLNQVNDNLQRIRELAVQASNGTNSQSDLESIQNEINQRMSEIDRISKETDFNGTRVLAEDSDLKIQVGSDDGQTISVGLQQITSQTLGLDGFNVDGSGEVANRGATVTDLLAQPNVTDNGDNTYTVNQAFEGVTLDRMLGELNSGDTVTTNGTEYTFNADSGDFSFTETSTGYAELAKQHTPATGSTNTGTFEYSDGSVADFTVDASGNLTIGGQTAYLSAEGELTTNDPTGTANQATLEGLFTQMGAASDAASGNMAINIDGASYSGQGSTSTFDVSSLDFSGNITASNGVALAGATYADGSALATALAGTAEIESATFDAETNELKVTYSAGNEAIGSFDLTDSAGTPVTVSSTADTGAGVTFTDTASTAEVLSDADGNTASINLASGITSATVAFDASGDLDTANGTGVYVDMDDELTTTQSVETKYGVNQETGAVTVLNSNGEGKYAVEEGATAYVNTSGQLTTDDTSAGERTEDPLAALDSALAQVDSLRSDLGAIQNRFESAITNLQTNETNLSAARSRIEDADYATEVANMTRAQILQQAGTSVLAQANQIPQNVLSLLG